MRTTALAACSLAAALAAAAAARADATGPRRFPFVKDLLATNGAAAGAAVCALDGEVLREADLACANLRVLDSAGVETPFLVRPRMKRGTAARETDVPFRKDAFASGSDNRASLVIEQTTKDELLAPGRLVFLSPQKNFEKQVSVLGSPDREHWELLADRQPIFDYARFVDVRNVAVAMTPRAYRWYRIEISGIAEVQASPLIEVSRERRGGRTVGEAERGSLARQDFRIDDLRLVATRADAVETTPEECAWPVSGFACRDDPERRRTVLVFSADGAPLTALRVATADANFRRETVVEGTDTGAGDDGWQTVAQSHIACVRIGGVSSDETRIGLGAPARHRRYRVTIANEDNPPLAIRGIEAFGQRPELVFIAKPGLSYRLYYGGSAGESPRYDIASVLPAGPLDAASRFAPGPQRNNPAFRAAAVRSPLGSRAFLVGAVILAAAVLLWLVLSAARRLGRAPPEG